MEVTVDLQGPDGEDISGDDQPFQKLRATRTIAGAGALEGDLTDAMATDIWRAGHHRAVVNVDATPWHAVSMENIRRSNPVNTDAGRHYIFAGTGLAARFDTRLIRPTYAIRDDVDVIVESLLDNAQDQLNGPMGFTMGTATGTFPERYRGFCFGQVIGDELRELAQLGRGFDWEIDASGALNLWTPTRGTSTAFTLADSNCTTWECSDDTSEMLTTVTALGDSSQPYGPRRVMVRAGTADTYGRRELPVFVDSTLEAELEDAALAQLKASGGGHLQVSCGWWEESSSKAWSLGDVELGDEVEVELEDIFGGTQDMRLVEIVLNAEPGRAPAAGEGLHFIEHTFTALVVDDDIEIGDPDEGS